MSSFRVLINRMEKAFDKVNQVERELSEKVEKKLGEGWGVIQQTDGVCVADIHANNYAVPLDDLIDALSRDKSEAIEIIKKYGI